MTNHQGETSGNRRNNMIQIFRALSILAVVMIHTTPNEEYQVLYRPFINFSVAAFLFLSGYLTKIENNNWYAFRKKRITRVIIPYVIWTIIYSLQYLNSGFFTTVTIKNLLTAQAAATMYYIFVYIQFVLLTPLLGLLAKSRYRHLGWLIAPISILIFKYCPLLIGTNTNTYIQLFWCDTCFVWFTYYYLGLLLGNKIIRASYSLKGLLVLYAVSIILQIAEGAYWLSLGELNCGTQIKLSALITSTIFLLIIYTVLSRPNINIKNKLLRLFGDYSFGIYLCHIMFIAILHKSSFYNALPYPLTSAVVAIISLGACYIFNKICGERVSKWLGLI